MGDVQLRRKFQACCLAGLQCYDEFNSFAKAHIDWRWEFLSAALDGLLPLWDDLVTYWDEAKMLRGETSKLDNENVKKTTKVLKCHTSLSLQRCSGYVAR